MAGAPKGNKNGTKIKETDLRQEAYRQYCSHISSGRDKKGWKFVHPTDPLKSLTHRTMERYMDEDPIEFPPILMDMAEADSFRFFEDEGFKLMRGQYRNGSPETWKTFMRNKFKWDKEIAEQFKKCAADEILEEMRSRNSAKTEHYRKIKEGK